MEARIESARRASEIHKRRTGRALRVTEQDVANEEMYEEEDDDLPRKFQGIPAHLKTADAEYNKKLHAYLVSQSYMRSAVGGGGPQYGPYAFGPTNYSAPMMGMRPIPQANAQMYQRHQPYPNVNGQASSGQYSRSASISNATTTGIPPSPQPLSDQSCRNTISISPANSGSSESVKEINDSPNMNMNSAISTPHSSSNFSTPNPPTPHMMAPASLSQDVYPGVQGNYNRIFTSELPKNLQDMGFSATPMNDTSVPKNNTNTSNNSDFGTTFNTKFNVNNTTTSNDNLKPTVYTGRTGLNSTLPPYMQNELPSNPSSINLNFPCQSNFENGNLQAMGNFFTNQDSNFNDAWNASLWTDEFTDYEGFALGPPMDGQEEIVEES